MTADRRFIEHGLGERVILTVRDHPTYRELVCPVCSLPFTGEDHRECAVEAESHREMRDEIRHLWATR